MLEVRRISSSEHSSVIESLPWASFLQIPEWAGVKSVWWAAESIGWFDGDELVGTGLVLYRKVPKLNRFLAYLPEGPLLNWDPDTAGEHLRALIAYAKAHRSFAVRMGPPVVLRRWHASTVKSAIAEKAPTTLTGTPADVVDHSAMELSDRLIKSGWREVNTGSGFGSGQAKFHVWLPLDQRSDDDILAGMNQLWRRNIRKAAKAGVEVTRGTRDDLDEFHRVYLETAERDQFTPRPLSYFEGMWDAMSDSNRLTLYLAHHEGDLVAATTMVRVGDHAWYGYGASTTAKRDVRGSNAIQWQMIRDARDAGVKVYDLRGVNNALDPDDPLMGLMKFKIGTGGDTVEHLGEWDMPINRLLYRAFTMYVNRR